MAETTTVKQGVITSVVRMLNSISGNPKFKITMNHSDYITKADVACAFNVDQTMVGRQYVLVLDKSGRIIDFEPVLHA